MSPSNNSPALRPAQQQRSSEHLPHRGGRQTRHRGPARTVVSGLLLVIALLAGGMAFAGPATASSMGCNYPGTLTLCETVNGSGNWVDNVNSGFTTFTSPVCNWTVSAEFFDQNNRWYRTIVSPVHYGCGWLHGSDQMTVQSRMATGYVCSTLRSYGNAVLSRCQNIRP